MPATETIDIVPHDDPDTIALHVYERYFKEGARYLRIHRARTYGEVYEDLSKLIYSLGSEDEGVEYVSFAARFAYPSREEALKATIPDWGIDAGELIRFACYAVEGGSEGHYVHVDLVRAHTDPKRQDLGITENEPFALVKTFCGWEHAGRIARHCAQWLAGGG